MKNIAILASGSGTNAENIIRYFSNHSSAKVVLVLSNNPKAFVIKRAESLGVQALIFDRNDFSDGGRVLQLLSDNNIDLIVLAGFLWLVPEKLTGMYHGRIINIHPALLPKYGGKGMYGDAVHKAVIENGETESGITIHYADNRYDCGEIIFQARCPVLPGDTYSTLAARIHELEYEHFPRVIGELIVKLP